MKTVDEIIFNALYQMRGKSSKKQIKELVYLDDRDKLDLFVNEHFISLLKHSYRHVPYYNRLFNIYDLVEDDKIEMSKFQDIPILTKKTIRKNHPLLISDDIQKRHWRLNSSGGSTGEPIRVIQDRKYEIWGKATNNYYYSEILGINEQCVKKVILWGSERDIISGTTSLKTRILNKLTNTLYLNSFRMTKNDMENYIRIINTYKPKLIRGYAGSLYELCKFAEKYKIQIYSPEIVISSAETLREEMKFTIEEILGTKVYNFYGSREISNLAGECKNGELHTFKFWNYIEVLDNNGHPVPEGKEGRVVVTNLFNYSMPLIRYDIGDLAIQGSNHCKCGNIQPTLKKIVGRITDHFILENGTIINGEYFTHLFYLKKWVSAFQIIQEDHKYIHILVVPIGQIKRSEQRQIEEQIKLVMGKDCKIRWEYVKKIPKTRNGKYRYTISNILLP